jgi:hypothetical protein
MRIGQARPSSAPLVRQSPLIHGRFSFQDEVAGPRWVRTASVTAGPRRARAVTVGESASQVRAFHRRDLGRRSSPALGSSPSSGTHRAAEARDRRAEALAAGELRLVDVLQRAALGRSAATRDRIAAAEDRAQAVTARARAKDDRLKQQ